MLPQLPPNSWTISDTRGLVTDTSWLGDKENRQRGELLRIDEQLRLLHQYDDYERQTSPAREEAKAALLARKRELIEKKSQ